MLKADLPTSAKATVGPP